MQEEYKQWTVLQINSSEFFCYGDGRQSYSIPADRTLAQKLLATCLFYIKYKE